MTCRWTVLDVSDDAVTWRTECDHAYYFESDMRPTDICFHFCPGCGKRVDDAPVPLARTMKAERKLYLVKKHD